MLRRIIGGERGDGLLDGLDLIDTAIATEVLARLGQPPTTPTEEQPMTGIAAIIAAFDDDPAVRVLADIADYETRLFDPAELRAIETPCVRRLPHRAHRLRRTWHTRRRR